jgi:Protein of unknown function, DUF417
MTVLAERRASGRAVNDITVAPQKFSENRRTVERPGGFHDSLWPRAGRSDEIYRLRGQRHPADGGKQSVHELVVWISQRTGIFKFTWRRGNYHCSDDWAWALSLKVSAIGSLAGVLMFLTTISFLFSTPGWEPSLGGFPALAVVPGQFLLKDIVLVGASVWSLGEPLAST